MGINSQKISVIIPVYNCEGKQEFKDLLESLKTQDYSNYEVLLCDDGSSDETLRICEKMVKLDRRFKILPGSHIGVSATRNRGIAEATGEWVTFVDSDDLLTESFLSGLIKPLRDNSEIELVFGSFIIVSSCTEVFLYHDQIYRGRDEIRKAFVETRILERCSPWAKLFKLDIIRNNKILFDTALSHSEDRHFIYNYLLNVSCIATSSVIGYIYGSYSPGSLKYKEQSLTQIKDRQEKIKQAGERVINKFGLTADQSFFILRNYIHLYKEGIRGICLQKLGWGKIKSLLEQFSCVYFDEEFKEKIQIDDNLANIICNDKELSLLHQGKLRKVYRYYRNIEFKTRVHSKLKFHSKERNEEVSFSKGVKYLN